MSLNGLQYDKISAEYCPILIWLLVFVLDCKWSEEWRFAIWWNIRFFGSNCWTHPNKKNKSKFFVYNYFSFVFSQFSLSVLYEIFSFKLTMSLNRARLGCCLHKSAAPQQISLKLSLSKASPQIRRAMSATQLYNRELSTSLTSLDSVASAKSLSPPTHRALTSIYVCRSVKFIWSFVSWCVRDMWFKLIFISLNIMLFQPAHKYIRTNILFFVFIWITDIIYSFAK